MTARNLAFLQSVTAVVWGRLFSGISISWNTYSHKKVFYVSTTRTYRLSRCVSPLFLTIAVDGSEWLTWRSGHMTPHETTLVFFEYEAGWAPETPWTFWRREKSDGCAIQTCVFSLLVDTVGFISYVCFFFPLWGAWAWCRASQSHSDTPHSVGLLWTSDQPDAETSDNIQHSHDTDIHATGGIRTRNPSTRADADPRVRPRGHCDRLHYAIISSSIRCLQASHCSL